MVWKDEEWLTVKMGGKVEVTLKGYQEYVQRSMSIGGE